MEYLDRDAEIKQLEHNHKVALNNPWAEYYYADFNCVLQLYNEKGYEEAKEYIRKSDIYAYRCDEVLGGNE